jgi:hypothetical protein
MATLRLLPAVNIASTSVRGCTSGGTTTTDVHTQQTCATQRSDMQTCRPADAQLHSILQPFAESWSLLAALHTTLLGALRVTLLSLVAFASFSGSPVRAGVAIV